MRQRTRHSFTVEVKRGSKRPVQTTVQRDDPGTAKRQSAEAALFGATGPSATSRPDLETAEALFRRPHDSTEKQSGQEPSASQPSRRVLPDLLAQESVDRTDSVDRTSPEEAPDEARERARPERLPRVKRRRAAAPAAPEVPSWMAFAAGDDDEEDETEAAAPVPAPIPSVADLDVVGDEGQILTRRRRDTDDTENLRAGERWMRRLSRFARPQPKPKPR